MKAKTMLRKLRKKMTQKEVAELLVNTKMTVGNIKIVLGDIRSVTASTISDWEAGYRKPDKLITLALKFHA